MRCAIATLAVLLATVGSAAGSEVVDEVEVEVEVDVDAVSSSHAAVPRPPPPPRVERDGDRLTVGCVQLRMVPDYDGHSILVLTFLRDGRCGERPQEVTPPTTP